MTSSLYVPGVSICPKCRFRLVTAVINMKTASVSNSPAGLREVCPNDNTLMDPLSWKQYAEELEAARDQVQKPLIDRINVLYQENQTLSRLRLDTIVKAKCWDALVKFLYDLIGTKYSMSGNTSERLAIESVIREAERLLKETTH